jgi:NDP-sugar pyrophosphorylase family protein
MKKRKKPSWALILAGGEGTRLRPLTDHIPKPLIEVAGKPILEHQIAWLKENGITNVIFLLGYKSQQIREHFTAGSTFGINAFYSVEHSPLGRGGAIRHAMKLLPDNVEDFIVMNGDNICTQDLKPLVEQHQDTSCTATVLLVPYVSQYGVVTVEGIVVREFREKGILPGIQINAGIYIFRREIEKLLPHVGDHETMTFPLLIHRNALGAISLDVDSGARWYTMDTIADVERVGRELS